MFAITLVPWVMTLHSMKKSYTSRPKLKVEQNISRMLTVKFLLVGKRQNLVLIKSWRLVAQQYTRTDVAFSRQSSSGGGKKDFGEDLEIDKKLTAPLLCLTLSGVFLNDHFSTKSNVDCLCLNLKQMSWRRSNFLLTDKFTDSGDCKFFNLELIMYLLCRDYFNYNAVNFGRHCFFFSVT